MKVTRLMTEVTLVIADIEAEINGEIRSCPTLCAVIKHDDGASDSVIPLNTPDGRPIFLNMENVIKH